MQATLTGPSSWVAFPDDWACPEAPEALQRAPTPPRHAVCSSPLLCPVRKSEASKADIEYQTDLLTTVEKVKSTVRCSHLWVLLPGTPGVLWGRQAGSLLPPKALGRAARTPLG